MLAEKFGKHCGNSSTSLKKRVQKNAIKTDQGNKTKKGTTLKYLANTSTRTYIHEQNVAEVY